MSCTAIQLVTDKNEIFWGRTQDFERYFEYSGVKIPRNWNYNSLFTPIKTKYAVMGIVWAEENVKQYPVVLDGINEKGLVGGSFYFDYFYDYRPAKEIRNSGKTPLRGEELATWILINYKDCEDIVSNLNNDIGVTSEKGPMMGISVPQHVVFQDKTGRSVVIEPSKPNGFDIYENKVGVFTNQPKFDWHVSNLKAHLERSSNRKFDYSINEEIEPFKMEEFTTGLLGVPSDFKPESRFLRAAYHKLHSIEVTRENALHQLIHLLGTVNNPRGSLRISVGRGGVDLPWTQYSSFYDVTNKYLYVYFYGNRTLQRLSFKESDYSKSDIEYFAFRENEVVIDIDSEK
ncbi:linear amide C-N hydrolase [Tetragenococcus muriaticus]|uniref:Choloylglycine hydrolase n=1 Tax=Tetragenococcus muriaticus 3MR10-3 TaxID=1302648 RepID=A0A091CC12_9ENTE|nr:linear amide C-N hydrolase [Tetragenococcus muriaticus]KFN89528.1 choloylglycine hydrolase [Tetragenococcus muriaticus 3MR10-3]GMA47998.1 penicillin amidase [Tetragenococcus muriaticus]